MPIFQCLGWMMFAYDYLCGWGGLCLLATIYLYTRCVWSTTGQCQVFDSYVRPSNYVLLAIAELPNNK